MIEFMFSDGKKWTPTYAVIFQALPSLVNFRMRINGVTYTKITPEFVEAFEKEKMWEELGDART